MESREHLLAWHSGLYWDQAKAEDRNQRDPKEEDLEIQAEDFPHVSSQVRKFLGVSVIV